MEVLASEILLWPVPVVQEPLALYPGTAMLACQPEPACLCILLQNFNLALGSTGLCYVYQATVEPCGTVLCHNSLCLLHQRSAILLLLNHEQLCGASHQR